MQYIKPELNQFGVAESLILGSNSNGSEGGKMSSDAFEFEE
jgi:hypothetical protein